jgi:hypothetical protein
MTATIAAKPTHPVQVGLCSGRRALVKNCSLRCISPQGDFPSARQWSWRGRSKTGQRDGAKPGYWLPAHACLGFLIGRRLAIAFIHSRHIRRGKTGSGFLPAGGEILRDERSRVFPGSPQAGPPARRLSQEKRNPSAVSGLLLRKRIHLRPRATWHQSQAFHAFALGHADFSPRGIPALAQAFRIAMCGFKRFPRRCNECGKHRTP